MARFGNDSSQLLQLRGWSRLLLVVVLVDFYFARCERGVYSVWVALSGSVEIVRSARLRVRV